MAMIEKPFPEVTEIPEAHDVTIGNPSRRAATARARGRLIVFEGIDGAGTTTQARLAADHLRSRGIAVHATRQPSDGPVGRLLREILAGGHAHPDGSAPQAPMLARLFAADRLDHVAREVAPAIQRGAVVVSDRWYHSSLAYQSRAPWDFDAIARLNAGATRPDLTIFLRADPEVCAERRLAAGRVRELFDDLQVQRRVASLYEEALRFVWHRRQERAAILDGSRPIEDVRAQIADLLDAEMDRDPGDPVPP